MKLVKDNKEVEVDERVGEMLIKRHGYKEVKKGGRPPKKEQSKPQGAVLNRMALFLVKEETCELMIYFK